MTENEVLISEARSNAGMTATTSTDRLLNRLADALETLTAENERLRGALTDAREGFRHLSRTGDMSAQIMRDPARTGGWSGSERTASAFDHMGLRAARHMRMIDAFSLSPSKEA